MAKKVETDLNKNFAKDKVFAEEIATNLIDIWTSVKRQRENREEVWQQSYRAWTIDRTDTDKSYQGMANLSIPQLRKEIETMSRRIYKGLLPEDYLRSDPATGFTDEESSAIQTQTVRHYYDNVMQVKRVLYPWVKQAVVYGTAPVRQFWSKKENEMFYKKRVPYEGPRGEILFKAEAVKEKVVIYNAPKMRAEDIFNTWVYPHNAFLQEDIEITFWRTVVKKFDLEMKAKEGTAYIPDGLLDEGKSVSQDFEEQRERLEQFGDQGEYKSLQGNDYFELLECWCPLLLPGSDRPVSCVVEIVNGKACIRIQRNPYWHQQSPFDFGRFIIPPPGEFYGRGLPEAAISLQHQLDDTMNQTMDATTLSLNNITIINPAYAPNAESFEIEPGAKWWADPNAVKQMTFPDLTDSGYKAGSILRGWISELSDNQPQLPDPIAGKARSTGQAQMAISEWQTDLFTFIDFLSVEGLSSMAFKTHSLLQQFLTEEDVIRVSGKYAGKWISRVVSPNDLVGKYKFKWVGALQIENQAVKTQQMLNFMNVFKNLPPDAQGSVKVLWDNFIIKLMRDGFLIKDVDTIIETDHLRESTDPILEAKILSLGGDIKTVKSDNDQAHIDAHKFDYGKSRDLIFRAKMSMHIKEHEEQAQAKEAELKQVQMQMAALQAAGPVGGAPGGGAPGGSTKIPNSISQDNLERGQRLETGI